MTDRELMQMALDALLWVDEEKRIFSQRESIRRLRDRLAQPEPVLEDPKFWVSTGMGHKRPLHVAPPKREWVSIPDWEIHEMYNEPKSDAEMIAFAREFEAKLKEKNT